MIEVDGKKLSQRDVDDMLIEACKTSNIAKIVRCVEDYGANVNSSDQAGYSKVLIYALKACHKKDKDAETIIKYLVHRGANINFKHGTKGSNMESRPYFIYYAAANNVDVSDNLVYFLVRNHHHLMKNHLIYFLLQFS